jgi:hypothetical protein
MEQKQRNYVQDLKAWDLLRLEELEIKLVDELVAAKPRVTYFDREHLGEELHAHFLDRLRDLAGTAVIESIDYWMKGLADGHDGEFPELCFEFPYLQRYEDVDALTVAYCIDNEDGTRTELNRVTLERVLTELLKNDPPACMKRRARVTAAKLRDLAERIEKIVPHSPRQDSPSMVPSTR